MRVSWLALTLALPAIASAQGQNSDSQPYPAPPAGGYGQPQNRPQQPPQYPQNGYTQPSGGYAQPQNPQPSGYPPPAPGYGQQQYPQQNGYPPPAPGYGQQYPQQNGYPPPAGYPQSGYPPPAPGYGQQPPPQNRPPTVVSAAPPGPARLTLATHSMEVAQLVTTCANAVDGRHFVSARKSCGEAIAKEDTLAFAHYLLALASPPEASVKELTRAAELAKKASPGERLFIEGYRAMVQARTADAKKTYDQLVVTLPGDARARVARAIFKQTAGGDLEGAVADLQKAVELDAKYPAAYGMLALALADSGRMDDALTALKTYGELAPNEPNAWVLLSQLALRRNAVEEAVTQAKKALTLEPGFAVGEVALGDALLFSGKGKEGRRAYGTLIANDDPAVHHEGAMREARSWLFDGRGGDCERALAAEADLASKTKRPGDQADALVELARVQLDRGALSESGQSLRQARAALDAPETATMMAETDRRRLSTEALHVRAMVLGAIGERQLANARAEEMGVALKLAGDAHAGQKATALKGWIAARNGDDQAATAELPTATRPTLRMALALAAARSGDEQKAHAMMEELSRRLVNDMEGALTRPRAASWLRSQPTAVSRQPTAEKTKAD